MADSDRVKDSAELPGVHQLGPDLYAITSEPRQSRTGRRWLKVEDWLIGPPISSELEESERLSPGTAFGILGGDLIASSVYGPEAMIGTLALAGAGAFFLDLPLAAVITLLLALLVTSYQQTVKAYPSGAGGYVVAGDNLGATFGLIAGSALLIDYSLDVAVSIASGAESITSAVPQLAAAKVGISLTVLALIALFNLRGIRTTGFVFALPVYLYILSTLGSMAYGLFRWASGDLPTYVPPVSVGSVQPTEVLGLFLILRAFSSGAVALTGVEAVSNGVRYMKPPEVRNARITLAFMAVIFGALFLSTSFLAQQLHVMPDPSQTETVISQLTRTFAGRGAFYYVVQFSALGMLILAANTGFADFPRVLSQLARDRFLPEQFALRGRRLSFSSGILLVTALSALLILAFKSSLDSLIPLFTVGAFGTFTLSQIGMVRHWWRNRQGEWRLSMFINGLGGITTCLVLVIVVVSKFLYGAWVVVLLWPVLVLALRALGHHYQTIDKHISATNRWLSHHRDESDVYTCFVIPVEGPNTVVLNAINYARSLLHDQVERGAIPPIQAVHVSDSADGADRLQQEWNDVTPDIPLILLVSPYRNRVGAILRYLDLLEAREPRRGGIITVLLPEVVPTKLWQLVLHNGLALHLKSRLLVRPHTAVISVPRRVTA